MAEQSVDNGQVVGSTPTAPTEVVTDAQRKLNWQSRRFLPGWVQVRLLPAALEAWRRVRGSTAERRSHTPQAPVRLRPHL